VGSAKVHTLGIDLGQATSHTAIVLLADASTTNPVYEIVHTQRFPLATPYTTVIARIVEPLGRPPLLGSTSVAVDATGVGAAVLEQLTPRLPAGTRCHPIVITSGSTVSRNGATTTVPKENLITTIQLLFEHHRIRIAEHTVATGELIDELSNYTISLSAAGRVTYRPGQTSGHDDLVLALALAAWTAEHKKPPRLISHVPRGTIPTLDHATLRAMGHIPWPADEW
jgi:hypothetical protein